MHLREERCSIVLYSVTAAATMIVGLLRRQKASRRTRDSKRGSKERSVFSRFNSSTLYRVPTWAPSGYTRRRAWQYSRRYDSIGACTDKRSQCDPAHRSDGLIALASSFQRSVVALSTAVRNDLRHHNEILVQYTASSTTTFLGLTVRNTLIALQCRVNLFIPTAKPYVTLYQKWILYSPS